MRPIFFGIDKKYLQHLGVALESLFSNNNCKLEIHIMFHELEKIDIINLKLIAKKYNQSLFFHEINMSQFYGYKESYHFTKVAYFRLLIPSLLEKNYNSAIYFDSDVVFTGDISYLLNLDLLSYPLAAIGNPDLKSMRRFGFFNGEIYFDSGLLVINLYLWRKHQLHTKILEFIKANPEKLEFPDNDALNIIIKGNFMELSPIYSLQSNYLNKKTCDFSYFQKFGKIEEMFLNPLVIQYAGSEKPWHYLSVDYYKDLYWKYLKRTPFKDFKYKDKTLRNIIIKKIYRPIKNLLI